MEISKSVSLKVNIGDYQTVDLFCNIKSECEEKDLEKVGAKLHDYCVKEITKDRNTSLKYLAGLVSKEAKEKILNSEV